MPVDPNAPDQAAAPAAAPAATPAAVQTTPKPVPAATPKVAREVTGPIRRMKLPDTVYRHPNPVGRPKNPRG